ncbi:hypothetical protein [Endozoicomonas euniceicola]|uniref:Concanavalin A-like lectin/glucanase superfamily protein n=1 Tax=Endozoicomonas euniceicola TaxID=1234143 RepID=A0ABY6GQ94_9GAMM|nr:hypothetical protein [Endozoicomonas euniceicola]UYM14263.1 hypothetical protein NX720_15300 [Endozoicomonas euniceicola]
MSRRGLYPCVSPVVNSGRFKSIGKVWTPNYNGVNSYVEIPEWKPVGDYRVVMVVSISIHKNHHTVFDSRIDENDSEFWSDSSGVITWRPSKTPDIRLRSKRVAESTSLNVCVERVGDTYTLTVDGESTSHTEQNISPNANRIDGFGGFNPNNAHMLGQIHSIRLTDLENSSNSRYYESIIRSDEAPKTAILEDRYCNPVKQTLSTDSSSSVKVEATGDFFRLERLNASGQYAGVELLSVVASGTLLKITVTNFSGSNSDKLVAYLGNKYINIYRDGEYLYYFTDTGKLSFIFDESRQLGYAVTANIVVEAITHGQLINFGTSEPWVELKQ